MKKVSQALTHVDLPRAATFVGEAFDDKSGVIREADVLQFALDGRLPLAVQFLNPVPIQAGVVVGADTLDPEESWDESEDAHTRALVQLDETRYIRFGGALTTGAGLYDLALLDLGRVHVQRRHQELVLGQPAIECSYGNVVVVRDGVFYRLHRWASVPNWQEGDDEPDPQPAKGLPQDAVLVVRTAALETFISGKAPTDTDIDPELPTRRRRSIYKVIRTLARLAKVDVATPYKAAQQINSAMAADGEVLSVQTIADLLKDIDADLS